MKIQILAFAQYVNSHAAIFGRRGLHSSLKVLSSLACRNSLHNMPKDTEHLQNIEAFRNKLRQRNARYKGIGPVEIQVLGSRACGMPGSICVSSQLSKYVFNCGEGTQRLASEYKFKLSKMEHIFVTAATWKNIGGIPGLLLSLQDSGVTDMTLHGPQGLAELLNGIKSIVSLPSLKVRVLSTSDSHCYQDELMNVSYVHITKKDKEADEEDLNRYPEDETQMNVNSNGKRPILENALDPRRKKVMTGIQDERISSIMSYICTVYSMPGSLSLQKCLDKGITPGPQLGILKSGKDITLPDGTVVTSKDVCSPPSPNVTFMVVECPSEEFLVPFVRNKLFMKHQRSADTEDHPYCIFHFTPEKILNNPVYREWMDKFPSSTRHVVFNDGNDSLCSEAVHKYQYQLHLLHPEIFPLLKEKIKKSKEKEDHPLVRRMQIFDLVHMRPTKSYESKPGLSIVPRYYINEAFEKPGFLDALAELQTEISAKTKELQDSSEYPKVVMLGTGSSIPNKVRNTSGILLRLDEKRSIIFDCGEGTMGQMIRLFGEAEIGNILSTIKAVYISHIHADHHLGLVSILKEREKVSEEKICILAPNRLLSWFVFYDTRFEPISHLCRFFPNKNFTWKEHELSPEVEAQLFKDIGLKGIDTIRVEHTGFATGVSVTLENNQKIVYSGDTMPSENLIQMGKHCDLLIHEATMNDDLAREAHLKCHSTNSEAIKVGRLMEAKFILLTHFSQRYAKIPRLPEDSESISLKNVGIAYDNMEIRLSHLPLLPLLYPALKVLFQEDYLANEGRTSKRQLKNNSS